MREAGRALLRLLAARHILAAVNPAPVIDQRDVLYLAADDL
jgi:hypothetical protein